MCTPIEQTDPAATLSIYVSPHCPVCAYAYEVAATIRREFPRVNVVLVDIHQHPAELPDSVFATPTYLLNGQRWSLGNPSPELIQETFQKFT